MCNTSYCACKSSCPSCHINNDIIYFVNEVIKDWLTPAQAKENIEKIKGYYKQIDAYSLMEYLSWTMDEEKFKESLEQYKAWKLPRKIKPQWDDTIKISWQPNPNPECEIIWDKVWWRCRRCARIARYSKWTQCPMYWIEVKNEETQGSTVVEN